ncbi:MAG: globin family protein [Gammaproteobacteria bacterium]|nr:globin family protein [Gammaproteobacteria bacterium]
MTPEQKQLVKDSWAKVLPIKATAAELFYNRLFEVYPEVRPYFKGDMTQQGNKLMAMLNTAVNGLDNLEALIEPLKQSGKAHAGYGVKAEDYDKVGDAFLWTLEQGLGDGFTPDVKEAWTVVYTTVAGVMIDGADYDTVASPAPAKPKWWQTVFGAKAATS